MFLKWVSHRPTRQIHGAQVQETEGREHPHLLATYVKLEPVCNVPSFPPYFKYSLYSSTCSMMTPRWRENICIEIKHEISYLDVSGALIHTIAQRSLLAMTPDWRRTLVRKRCCTIIGTTINLVTCDPNSYSALGWYALRLQYGSYTLKKFMKKGTIIDFIFSDLILYSPPPGPGTFRGLNMTVTPEEDRGNNWI